MDNAEEDDRRSVTARLKESKGASHEADWGVLARGTTCAGSGSYKETVVDCTALASGFTVGIEVCCLDISASARKRSRGGSVFQVSLARTEKVQLQLTSHEERREKQTSDVSRACFRGSGHEHIARTHSRQLDEVSFV